MLRTLLVLVALTVSAGSHAANIHYTLSGTNGNGLGGTFDYNGGVFRNIAITPASPLGEPFFEVNGYVPGFDVPGNPIITIDFNSLESEFPNALQRLTFSNYLGVAGETVSVVIASSLNGVSFGYISAGIATPSAVVPLPAAIWLFGSALVGLIGVGRRKKA